MSKILFYISNTLIILTTLSLQLFKCHAHSFLIEPRPYIRGFTPDGCKGMDCKACPPFFRRPNLMNNTADRPEVVWRRGQRATIRWAKNNHVGGFIRLGFVPLNEVFEARVHDRLAFYYGCWEQGLHTCKPGQDCAADIENKALQRTITIPRYIPDGIYVFSFIWYGGLHHSGGMSQFADYPSCAYIEIKGGDEVVNSFQPYFKGGSRLPGSYQQNRCLTYIDHPHVCTTRPLTGRECVIKSFRTLPRPFQNGKQPPKIYSSFLTEGVSVKVTPSPSSSESPHISPSPSSSYSTYPSQSSKPTQFSSSPSRVYPGSVCRKGVCCLSSCGVCKIKWCATRDGGREGCCPLRIRKRGRYCDKHKPPCIIPEQPSIQPSPSPSAGICRGKVCCASSCGRCGGNGCAKLPGGGKGCCIKQIRLSKRLCNNYRPPCFNL